MRFLAAESVKECVRCVARTPHSRRRLAPLPFASALLVIVGSALAAVIWQPALGGLLLVVMTVGFMWLIEYEQGWYLECERCRGKWLAARRARRSRRWRGLRDNAPG